MRIGLIGLGRIGAFHAETLSRLPSVTSLVVTDAVPAAARAVAERRDVEIADSPDKLLAAGVDGVVIAAATDAHPDLLIAAADAGLPVFCEKPVARTMSEGVAVARRVAATGVPVQIGYPRRFDAGFTAARAAIANGELGWLHTVRSTTLDPAPPPPAYIAVSGGIFRDCSVHDFDAVRWVTGQEVVEVYATGSDRGDPIFADCGDASSPRPCSLSTTAHSPWCPTVATTHAATMCAWRCTVRTTASQSASTRDRRSVRRGRRDVPRRRTPYQFFMDRFADAFRASLAAFTEVVAGS